MVLKYKQWANDGKWLPEGSGLCMLSSQTDGAPTCSPVYQKNLEINVIEDCVKKCRRLNSDQRKWWVRFIENERRYQNKWSAVTEYYLCEVKGTGGIWTS